MLKIVDGLREKPHVTSNDHFGRNEGIVGISDYVLNVGRMFETELISSNELRIYDGEGMIQGCHWRILPGTYETVKLSNGTQGKKRIDYVVARYEKNSVGYEDIGISVKEGEATSGNPKPPAYITGDIRTGDTIREMVLAEIEYEGINVVEVTPKFKVLMTMAELQEKTDELNRNFANVLGILTNIKGIYVGSKIAACNQAYALLHDTASLTKILGKAPTASNFICMVMNGDANAAQTSYYSPRYYSGDGLYVYVYPNVTGSIRINYVIFAIE
jgi:hypothetical protein